MAAVLRLSLERSSLVRLANARRVNVPGMRNQSVPADRLAAALAAKFAKEEASRRTLLSALDTANRKLTEEWRQLSDADALARVADEKLSTPAAARLLYVISRERRESIGIEQARMLLARCRPPAGREPAPAGPAAAPGPTELQSLQQEHYSLAARLADAEQALERIRRREKHLQQELAQKKFEANNLKLHVARGKEEQERLEKRLRELQERLEEAASRRKVTLPEELAARLAQIQDQGRKLAASVEKLAVRPPREDKGGGGAAAAAREWNRLWAEIRREQAGQQERSFQALAQFSQELAMIKERMEALGGAVKRPAPRSRVERVRDGLERVGLFVDVQNVFYGARQQNARLDFEALLQMVSRGRKLLRATAYVVESRDIDQSGFISLLQQKGYEVRRKPLKVRADGSFKGDWDMEIALDVLDISEALDVLVLVTGDGDFASLVQRVKALGVQVEIYSFPRNTAKELKEGATRFIPIDRRLLIKQPKEAPPEEPLEGVQS